MQAAASTPPAAAQGRQDGTEQNGRECTAQQGTRPHQQDGALLIELLIVVHLNLVVLGLLRSPGGTQRGRGGGVSGSEREAAGRRQRRRRGNSKDAARSPLGRSPSGSDAPQLRSARGPSARGWATWRGAGAGRSPACCIDLIPSLGGRPGRRGRPQAASLASAPPDARLPCLSAPVAARWRQLAAGGAGEPCPDPRWRAHRTTAAVASSRSSARCRHCMVPSCWISRPRAIGLQVRQGGRAAPRAAWPGAGGRRACAAALNY